MKYLVSSLLVLNSMFAFDGCSPGSGCCMDCIVHGRISPENKNFNTYSAALELIKERNCGVLVEINRDPINLDSTLVFSDYIMKNFGFLHSYWRQSTQFQNLITPLGGNSYVVDFRTGNLAEQLKALESPIDFLYVDSGDGSETNPKSIKQRMLNQFLITYPKLTQKSIVLVEKGRGKGSLVTDALLEKGWKIVKEGSQILFVKK